MVSVVFVGSIAEGSPADCGVPTTKVATPIGVLSGLHCSRAAAIHSWIMSDTR